MRGTQTASRRPVRGASSPVIAT